MRFLLFLLLCIGSFPALAQEKLEILPSSETAESAYLYVRPGQTVPLRLNEKNLTDADLISSPKAAVIFLREGFLDRVVPVEPAFLKDGFPGDFTNLERYYTLSLVADPPTLSVYEVGRSSDEKEQRNYLGLTGGGPLRLDRLPYYDATTGDFHQVKLLFEKDGYESFILQVSSKELVPGKALGKIALSPLPGLGNRWKRSPGSVLAWGFLGLGLVVALSWLATRPKPAGVGDRLDGYELLERIGRGGTAEVFRARSEDGLEMALKIMLANDLGNEARERFRREIQASLTLVHPNLARIYDWGESPDGRLYLVSEILEGETLRQRLQELPVGKQRDRLVGEVLGEISQTLTFLHQENVVHRDIKPRQHLHYQQRPAEVDRPRPRPRRRTGGANADRNRGRNARLYVTGAG